jgi:acyl-CoA thioesterase-1
VSDAHLTQLDPVGSGRSGDVAVYNRIARRIMRANHIAIDDLYGFVLPREQRIQKPRNVHFTPAGYVALGSHVARSIAAALRATR